MIQEYEYKVVNTSKLNAKTDSEEYFNSMGKRGWLLVDSKDHILVFARPILISMSRDVNPFGNSCISAYGHEAGEDEDICKYCKQKI